MTKSIKWTALACVFLVFNMIIYPKPIDGLACSRLHGGGSLMSWMKVVKYYISKFLGNHKALIYQSNATINRKALSDFPILSNVSWGWVWENPVLGNPAWIVLISCRFSESALLALFRASNVISLLVGGV